MNSTGEMILGAIAGIIVVVTVISWAKDRDPFGH